MFNELTWQMLKLTRDSTFMRNLSLTFILAIACLFTLADLQSQNNKVSDKVTVTNVSNSNTRFIVKSKQNN